jgi:alanine racemase
VNAVENLAGDGRALWAEIGLDAIASNFDALQRMVGPGVTIWACLKGNGYGCGAAAVGRRLARAGARAFAVGDIGDALALRRVGLGQPVLLYPDCLPGAAATVERERFAITLSSVEEAAAWQAALRSPVDVFLKIDTGAFRLGVMPSEAAELAARVAAAGCFRLRGLYAHLNLPDPATMGDYARAQFERFRAAAAAIEAIGIDAPVRMVAGTAVVLGYPEMDLNAVDPGRVLYGIGFKGTARAPALRHALRALRAALLLVKTVRPGDTAGFPGAFPVTTPMRIGVVPIGFADGFPRPAPVGTVVLVRGRRVPVLGPTHFEHLRLDLTSVPEARYGDVVTFVGADGDDAIGVEEAAAMWGTTVLELYGGLRRTTARR